MFTWNVIFRALERRSDRVTGRLTFTSDEVTGEPFKALGQVRTVSAPRDYPYPIGEPVEGKLYDAFGAVPRIVLGKGEDEGYAFVPPMSEVYGR